MSTLATVAIIGRPNVGKSTLFNASIGFQKSIVSNIPGTTRDRVIEKIIGDRLEYFLVDTAGLTDDQGQDIESSMNDQARLATANADLILWVIDSRRELTLDDYDILEQLRSKHEKVLVVGNKCDDGTDNLEILGLGFETIFVSAKNNFNLFELEDKIEDILIETFEPETEEVNPDAIYLTFIGRPNVGKSSLLNAFLKENRAIVSDIQNTTRDSIDTKFVHDDQTYIFTDTAGLRRPGKRGRDLEFWASVRTQRSIERSDVCIMMIDAIEGMTHQDLSIIGKVLEAGKGLILGVNKFDLVRDKSRGNFETDEREETPIKMDNESLDEVRQQYLQYLAKKGDFIPWVPVHFFSAKTGKGIFDILPSAKNIFEERAKRISTSKLNLLVPEIYHKHIKPSIGTKIGKIKYISQVDTAPPKFLVFVNNTEAFHFSYKRYVENQIREHFGFYGTPVIVEFRDAMKKFRNGKNYEEPEENTD